MSAEEHSYKAIGDKSEIQVQRGTQPYYLVINFVLSENYVTTTRSVYTLLDVCGDFGGVSEVFFILSAILIAPIADHLFFIKAIQKLYLANTVEEGLFVDTKNPKKLKRKEVD